MYIKIFDFAIQVMFTIVSNNFVSWNKFFIQSNDNKNKHIHESDWIKSKKKTCTGACIRKRCYDFMWKTSKT